MLLVEPCGTSKMFEYAHWGDVWLERVGFGIGIEMGDSHSNHSIRGSLISISISGWNGNSSIYIELNSYSPLWIQIFIPILILISVTNQILWRIWLFRFRFQVILISIPILIPIANQKSLDFFVRARWLAQTYAITSSPKKSAIPILKYV